MSVGLFRSNRVMWMPLNYDWRPATVAVERRCPSTITAMAHTCDRHATPFECAGMAYREPFNQHGIPIRDGSASYLLGADCARCGTPILASRRDAWLDDTDGIGHSGSPLEALPAKYPTEAWRMPGAS